MLNCTSDINLHNFLFTYKFNAFERFIALTVIAAKFLRGEELAHSGCVIHQLFVIWEKDMAYMRKTIAIKRNTHDTCATGATSPRFSSRSSCSLHNSRSTEDLNHFKTGKCPLTNGNEEINSKDLRFAKTTAIEYTATLKKQPLFYARRPISFI